MTVASQGRGKKAAGKEASSEEEDEDEMEAAAKLAKDDEDVSTDDLMSDGTEDIEGALCACMTD